ncbi:MAG: hypothetical protein K2X26_10235 [Chitinophagaceae bacterium]|nr:hypothetical protein [Chitinophagaceae bacterium]
MKKIRIYIFITLSQSIFFALPTSAQFGGTTPSMPGLDTAIMRRDTVTISVDPDPTNNPFMRSSGTIRSNDDPGGPGSGGGFGSPPPDAVIPIDGGVGFLIAGGTLLAAGRYRKKKPKL